MSPRQRRDDEIAIIELGLCTPLGLTTRASQVEIAAGTVRFCETDVLDDSGEPLRASMLSLLEPELTRMERMTSLAVTALQEPLKAASALGIEQLPLLLSLPERESGSFFDQKALLEALVANTASPRLEIAESMLFPEGRAGFFRALAEASRLLKSRRAVWVLVGGVDSMCDRDSLSHHARSGRSLGAESRDGILPGEGAGFFLLTSTLPSRQHRVSPRGWIVACALSHEPNDFLQREPNLARGLTEAFRQLRSHPVAGARRVDHLLSCQTGEMFWAQEFNAAYLRNAQLMPEPLTMSLVAESLGDVGAAAGSLQLGSALHLLKKREHVHGTPGRALVYGCADAGHVGACVVEGTYE
jgi:3-oxoacyl-[acyl-carrier-protein] synthase-1